MPKYSRRAQHTGYCEHRNGIIFQTKAVRRTKMPPERHMRRFVLQKTGQELEKWNANFIWKKRNTERCTIQTCRVAAKTKIQPSGCTKTSNIHKQKNRHDKGLNRYNFASSWATCVGTRLWLGGTWLLMVNTGNLATLKIVSKLWSMLANVLLFLAYRSHRRPKIGIVRLIGIVCGDQSAEVVTKLLIMGGEPRRNPISKCNNGFELFLQLLYAHQITVLIRSIAFGS